MLISIALMFIFGLVILAISNMADDIGICLWSNAVTSLKKASPGRAFASCCKWAVEERSCRG